MVKNLISIFLFLFPLIAKCEWSFTSGTGGGTLTDNTGWSLSLTLSDTSFSITKCNATGTETDIDLSDEISGFPIGYEITAIQNVFSGKAITSFTPPLSLTTIGANAFKNCSSLTNIVFPDNLAVINTSAFENCTALKQVILPDSPHIIGDYAFRNIGAELVSFGKKSVTIKNSAFINSPAVKRIYFRGDAPNMANGYAFQNSAKNNADSTLANKTRCYFIPFGNSTWDYVNAAQLLNDGDIENFELLFSDIPAKPAGLFNWFSLRSKNNDIKEDIVESEESGRSSLRKLVKDQKTYKNFNISHETIRKYLKVDTPLYYLNTEVELSGYYGYDAQWFPIDKKWEFRLVLFDLVNNVPVAEKICKKEDSKTVKKFIENSIPPHKRKAIVTDLKKDYDKIMRDLGFDHQHCTFHLRLNINEQIRKHLKQKETKIKAEYKK